MLKLSAAHLKEQRRKDPSKRIVWLDIGGGTGWNVEDMDKVSFLDTCEGGRWQELTRFFGSTSRFRSLMVCVMRNLERHEARPNAFGLEQRSTCSICAVPSSRSRKSASRLAASRTSLACSRTPRLLFFPSGRATESTLPARWTLSRCPTVSGECKALFERSLGGTDTLDAPSMMPDYYSLIDRIERFISPTGLLSVCDFYVSAREKTSLSAVIGDVASRQIGWFSRHFWMTW